MKGGFKGQIDGENVGDAVGVKIWGGCMRGKA